MSISSAELFRNAYGYDPAWHYGSDSAWMLGAHSVPKPVAKATPAQAEKEPVVVLKFPICCGGCVDKVRKKLKQLEGVASVNCETDKNKVTVVGTAKPETVLKEARKIQQRAELWKHP